jgi:osmotically-inducible protein OsmY
MRRHPWADRSLTSVIVTDGVVRLEGYCRSEEARPALRVLAEQVEGVREVIDRMEIAPSYPTVPPL